MIKMIKMIKVTLLTSCMSISLFAHGQPDNILGMSTMVSVAPTVSITDNKSEEETKEAVAQKFINDNQETLQVEMAQGEGESLDTLATLYGIEDKEVWKSSLQEHYQESVPQDEEEGVDFKIEGEVTLYFEKSFK